MGTAERRSSCNRNVDFERIFECRVIIVDSFYRCGSGQGSRVNSTVPLFVKRKKKEKPAIRRIDRSILRDTGAKAERIRTKKKKYNKEKKNHKEI